MYTNNFFGIGSGFQGIADFHPVWMVIIGLVALWDLVWRGIGMWHAARNGQHNWFVALLLVNSIGILPILYIKLWQHKNK